MSVRVLTLFDDEPAEPSRPAAAKKKRAVTKKEPVPEPVPEVSATEPAAISAEAVPAGSPPPAPKKETAKAAPAADKNYYTIGETAELFRVRTSHIRFWTIQFALKVRTTRKGDRLYTPENIERLKLIHHLVKEQGYTIAGAKTRLKELRNLSAEDVQKASLKGALLLLRKQLTVIRDQL
jgi:DNA-binding transcriptional MerR regulator